ncbi:nucleoside 2-deoxyribosyltransferase [Planomonospora parontospora]|uniref:nucleoside 2-deoxyribosyltransferase n=1 Tax=Planomonospora parontospora TaxID=58119 RepID=UPI0016709EBF|nr:nucleoside 2-deoxyribosyltransferase [Planomonospora parontospora]GGL42369.1 hypothetical protein GCM10014719_49600 [Planomonospora parontospora subsp. antibiotica]GII18401.1 hypothetical protein Ppa05_51270 [Planomonospora parontospora subsp. antibiotica]
MTPTGSRVFLAAPYSQWMDPSTGLVETRFRERLDRLRRGFLDRGAQVFSAHHNEQWGAGWLPAEECTPADFQAMRVADVVCAVIGSPPSGGVAVELGWASALGKPILVVTDEGGACTPMIRGIHTVTRAAFVTAGPDWTDAFADTVIDATLALVRDGGGAPYRTGDPGPGYVTAAGA